MPCICPHIVYETLPPDAAIEASLQWTASTAFTRTSWCNFNWKEC
jgi:hypothetical protein